MKVALGIISSLIAIPFLAFVGLMGFNTLTLEARTAKAASVCQSILPNMPAEELSSIRYTDEALSYKEGNTVYFAFPGLLSLHGPHCSVSLKSGKVVSVSTGSESW